MISCSEILVICSQWGCSSRKFKPYCYEKFFDLLLNDRNKINIYIILCLLNNAYTLL